jgi:hypothetical protein
MDKINMVVMLHSGCSVIEPFMVPYWTKFGGVVVAVDNPDCSHSYAWVDRVVTWHENPGHHGISQCLRHFKCVEIAASLTGPTAILESDSFVLNWFKVKDGILYGSKIWDSEKCGKPTTDLVAKTFVHPPYVASSKTWKGINEITSWWKRIGSIHDSGHSDRVLSLAAQISGASLSENGFSRNTVMKQDIPDLNLALQRNISLVHGIKTKEILQFASL